MDPRRLASFLRLIVITDDAMAAPRGGVFRVVERALGAGARTVQLRMKDAAAGEMLEAARRLRKMTRAAGALLFVNDRMDVALAADADGVHLGPDDLPVGPVREAVGRDLLIGCSADRPESARRAVAAGADYIGCGTVYSTDTKADAGEVIRPEGLDAVAGAVDVPVVGIGGVSPVRAPELARTRASGVAVISAVMGADDPGRAVRELLEPFGGPPDAGA